MWSLVHGLVNILGFIFMVVAVIFARRHSRKYHHLFLAISLIFLSFGVILMIYLLRGLWGFHCYFGLFVYVFSLFVLLSGKLFMGRKIKRSVHKAFGILVLVLLLIQCVLGIVLSRF